MPLDSFRYLYSITALLLSHRAPAEGREEVEEGGCFLFSCWGVLTSSWLFDMTLYILHGRPFLTDFLAGRGEGWWIKTQTDQNSEWYHQCGNGNKHCLQINKQHHLININGGESSYIQEVVTGWPNKKINSKEEGNSLFFGLISTQTQHLTLLVLLVGESCCLVVVCCRLLRPSTYIDIPQGELEVKKEEENEKWKHHTINRRITIT